VFPGTPDRTGSESAKNSPNADTAPESAGGRVLVAVCTLNEMANLPELVARIFQALPTADLLVVDDDSPDQTGQWAQTYAATDPRLRVLIRKDERGLGSAIRKALEYAVEQDYEYVLNLDADLSHAPEALPELLKVATSAQRPDVVVGSRYCRGGEVHGWSLRRKLMSRMVNRFAVSVLRLPVSDCSGSLRCYRVATLRKIDPASLQSNGYAILEEILLKLMATGAKMAEVPIVFTDRQRGESKLTWNEATAAAKQLIRMARQRN